MAQKQTPEYIINDLTLISPDRQRKDIQSLKTSVITAESIYYPNRTGLYDLYHDIYTMDGFLHGIIAKRIDNVLNKKLQFLGANGEINRELTGLMNSETGRKLITQILESKFWGISGVEFKIGEAFDFDIIPRKHIKPEKGIITRHQYNINEDEVFDYKNMPLVWVIGEPNDLGLLLTCSMYALYKRGNFGDWAQYVELFGQPVRIIYYDAYDTKTKQELKQLLETSGNSLAMMIPKQAEFSMLDGKTSNGNGQLQLSFKDACNHEMAVCVLGNTETTTSSSSSGYAQSAEHGQQQNEIIKSDLHFVANMLNSAHFMAILRSYGYELGDGRFQYHSDLDLATLKMRIEIDTILSAKIPIDDDYYYHTYGIPKPRNYEQLKQEMLSQGQELGATAMPVSEQGKKKSLVDRVVRNISGLF